MSHEAGEEEFGSMAGWTAEAVRALGPDHAVPAAHAATAAGVRPLLVEPMEDACRAAADRFGLPTVVAAAQHLPLPDGAAPAAWCLGVLCTVPDQGALVRELARALAPGARAGLLVYEAQVAVLSEEPEVNHFPRPEEVDGLLASAGLVVVDTVALADLPAPGSAWDNRADAVDAWVEAAHGHSRAWAGARADERAVGRMLDRGEVAGRLLVVTRA